MHLKYLTFTFTSDKPVKDMRMILTSDTPCPQMGNENGLTYSPNTHHSFPMCPSANIVKVKQYDMSGRLHCTIQKYNWPIPHLTIENSYSNIVLNTPLQLHLP